MKFVKREVLNGVFTSNQNVPYGIVIWEPCIKETPAKWHEVLEQNIDEYKKWLEAWRDEPN